MTYRAVGRRGGDYGGGCRGEVTFNGDLGARCAVLRCAALCRGVLCCAGEVMLLSRCSAAALLPAQAYNPAPACLPAPPQVGYGQCSGEPACLPACCPGPRSFGCTSPVQPSS